MAIEKKSLMGNKKVSSKKAGKVTAPTTTKLQTAVQLHNAKLAKQF